MNEHEGGERTVYRLEVWRDGGCREAEVFLGEPKHTRLASHRDDTGVPMYKLIEACAEAIVGHHEAQHDREQARLDSPA